MLPHGYELTVVDGGFPLRGTAVFPQEYPAFQGHFPGHPILPGFMHIQLALDCLAVGGRQVTLEEVAATKFVQPILPERPVLVEIRQTEAGVDVEITSGGELCSRMSLVISGAR